MRAPQLDRAAACRERTAVFPVGIVEFDVSRATLRHALDAAGYNPRGQKRTYKGRPSRLSNEEARAAYARALELTRAEPERRFLARRVEELGGAGEAPGG